MKTLIFILASSFILSALADDPPAAPPVAAPPSFAECEGKLQAEFARLIEADTNGILALQFQLTTLKLTKKQLGKGQTTLEQAVRANSATLAKFNEEDSTILARLTQLYKTQGGADQTKALQASLKELKSEAGQANYNRRTTRLDNQDVAALLIHDQLTNKETDVTELDVSIAWFMNKVADEIGESKGEGSAAQNLNLLSVQLARNLGYVGTRAMTTQEVDGQIASAQQKITAFLNSALQTIKADLKECFPGDKWKGECTLGISNLNDELARFLMSVEDVSKFVDQTGRATARLARAEVVADAAGSRSSTAKPASRAPARLTAANWRAAQIKIADSWTRTIPVDFECGNGRSVILKVTRKIPQTTPKPQLRISLAPLGAKTSTSSQYVRTDIPYADQWKCVQWRVMHECQSDPNFLAKGQKECFGGQ